MSNENGVVPYSPKETNDVSPVGSKLRTPSISSPSTTVDSRPNVKKEIKNAVDKIKAVGNDRSGKKTEGKTKRTRLSDYWSYTFTSKAEFNESKEKKGERDGKLTSDIDIRLLLGLLVSGCEMQIGKNRIKFLADWIKGDLFEPRTVGEFIYSFESIAKALEIEPRDEDSYLYTSYYKVSDLKALKRMDPNTKLSAIRNVEGGEYVYNYNSLNSILRSNIMSINEVVKYVREQPLIQIEQLGNYLDKHLYKTNSESTLRLGFVLGHLFITSYMNEAEKAPYKNIWRNSLSEEPHMFLSAIVEPTPMKARVTKEAKSFFPGKYDVEGFPFSWRNGANDINSSNLWYLSLLNDKSSAKYYEEMRKGAMSLGFEVPEFSREKSRIKLDGLILGETSDLSDLYEVATKQSEFSLGTFPAIDLLMFQRLGRSAGFREVVNILTPQFLREYVFEYLKKHQGRLPEFEEAEGEFTNLLTYWNKPEFILDHSEGILLSVEGFIKWSFKSEEKMDSSEDSLYKGFLKEIYHGDEAVSFKEQLVNSLINEGYLTNNDGQITKTEMCPEYISLETFSKLLNVPVSAFCNVISTIQQRVGSNYDDIGDLVISFVAQKSAVDGSILDTVGEAGVRGFLLKYMKYRNSTDLIRSEGETKFLGEYVILPLLQFFDTEYITRSLRSYVINHSNWDTSNLSGREYLFHLDEYLSSYYRPLLVHYITTVLTSDRDHVLGDLSDKEVEKYWSFLDEAGNKKVTARGKATVDLLEQLKQFDEMVKSGVSDMSQLEPVTSKVDSILTELETSVSSENNLKNRPEVNEVGLNHSNDLFFDVIDGKDGKKTYAFKQDANLADSFFKGMKIAEAGGQVEKLSDAEAKDVLDSLDQYSSNQFGQYISLGQGLLGELSGTLPKKGFEKQLDGLLDQSVKKGDLNFILEMSLRLVEICKVTKERYKKYFEVNSVNTPGTSQFLSEVSFEQKVQMKIYVKLIKSWGKYLSSERQNRNLSTLDKETLQILRDKTSELLGNNSSLPYIRNDKFYEVLNAIHDLIDQAG